MFCLIFSCFVMVNASLAASAVTLDVLKDGDSRLRTVCEEVTEFNEDLLFKVNNVKETLKSLDGAGLAANQVGYTERFFAISSHAVGELSNEQQRLNSDEPLVFINPQIISTDGKQTVWEACFSLDDFIYKLERPATVVINAFDEHGKPFTFKTQDFWAKCVCHEYDHLDGILCKDKATESQPRSDK